MTLWPGDKGCYNDFGNLGPSESLFLRGTWSNLTPSVGRGSFREPQLSLWPVLLAKKDPKEDTGNERERVMLRHFMGGADFQGNSPLC